MLITIAINAGAGTLICLPALAGKGDGEWILSAFLIIGLGLLIQLIVGLVMLVGEESKQTGKGMILAVGIILLVGFAICSSTVINLGR
jgi:hypothetical protein